MTIENVKAFVDECVKNLVHCQYPYEMQTLRDKAFGVCDFAVRCGLGFNAVKKIWESASAEFDCAIYNIKTGGENNERL